MKSTTWGRNIVNNIVIMLYDRWRMTHGDQTYHGERWVMYRIVESLCCTPETNTTLMSTIVQLKKKRLWLMTYITYLECLDSVE